ncbi:MAG: hypothetical protein ACLGIG_04375 [Actinomycetes bacterium]
MRTRLPAALALTAGAFLVGSPAALAQTADYPGTGESVLPTVVQQAPADVGVSDARPSVLPFTGGEIVLISVAGTAALAAGTALVVGGRRRSSTA